MSYILILKGEIKMTKYEKAMKLMDNLCGNEKEEIIAIATISLSPGESWNPRPSVRMVCAYYENGAFYVSTDAKKNKMLEIEKNNEVSSRLFRRPQHNAGYFGRNAKAYGKDLQQLLCSFYHVRI